MPWDNMSLPKPMLIVDPVLCLHIMDHSVLSVQRFFRISNPDAISLVAVEHISNTTLNANFTSPYLFWDEF